MGRDISLLGVLTALFFLLSLNALLLQRENRFFVRALSNSGTVHVEVGGAKYAVQNGAVFDGSMWFTKQAALRARRLAYAKLLATQNPLFALPDTNLDRMDANIAHMRTLQMRLKSLNASSSNASLLSALYPVNFLESLTKLERARRAFVASGSDVDETIYNRAAAATFLQHSKDARAYAWAFTRAVPPNSAKFATDRNIMSRADMLSAVAALTEGAQETSIRFAARVQCTRGVIGRCVPNDTALPTSTVAPEVQLSQKELTQAQSARALVASGHKQQEILQGPLLLLPSTQCVANIPGAPVFSFYTPLGSSSFSGPFPMYVGDIRFNTTSSGRTPSYTKFAAAMGEHVEHILDSPLLHYSCPEIAHDSTRLFAMRNTYAFAVANQLSAYAKTPDTRAVLTTLEQKNLAVLTEHAVTAYLDAAATLALPASLRSKVVELSLGYQFNSSNFDATLGELLNDEMSNAALVEGGWPLKLDVPYMFFVRSSFNTLLLSDNRSAVGELPPLFAPNTIEPSKQPFVYYSQMPHNQETISQLLKDIYFFYIIHEDPSLVTK